MFDMLLNDSSRSGWRTRTWPRRYRLWRSVRYLGTAMLILCLHACTGQHAAVTQSMPSDGHDAPAQAHWGYMGIEGPDHWAMLTKAYQTCEAGDRQSPINITATHPVQGGDTIAFRYAPARVFEVNNGHTINVSHETGCELGLGDHAYKLRQFHFHTPSEHQLHGNSFPMEMHLVHQDSEGRVLVVAVVMEAGSQTPVLNTLWNWLPDQIGREVSLPLRINIATILPPDPEYFSYSGSLTTPPCTEGVRWIVLKQPIQISEEDVRQFVDIIGYNARPVQPLKGREIYEN